MIAFHARPCHHEFLATYRFRVSHEPQNLVSFPFTFGRVAHMRLTECAVSRHMNMPFHGRSLRCPLSNKGLYPRTGLFVCLYFTACMFRVSASPLLTSPHTMPHASHRAIINAPAQPTTSFDMTESS